MKHRGGNPVVCDIVHVLEDAGNAVADRFQRIFGLLAVLLFNRIISHKKHNHAKNKQRNDNQAQKCRK
ncbi:hypothetical protein D3C85_1832980 [compost metagenome]